MLKKIIVVCFIFAVSSMYVSSEAAEKPETGNQSAAELNSTIPVKMKYLLYLPENYDEKEKWPLVLFLHGAGERGRSGSGDGPWPTEAG